MAKAKSNAVRVRALLKRGWSVGKVAKHLKLPYVNVYYHKRQVEGASKPIKFLKQQSKPVKLYSPPMTTEQAIERVKANEVQVGGAHYKTLVPQPWDVINAWGLGFLDGNVVKYVARFKNKGGVEDLRKAKHYLDKLIEVEEKK